MNSDTSAMQYPQVDPGLFYLEISPQRYIIKQSVPPSGPDRYFQLSGQVVTIMQNLDGMQTIEAVSEKVHLKLATVQYVVNQLAQLHLLADAPSPAFFTGEVVSHPFSLFARLRSEGPTISISQPYQVGEEKVWLVTQRAEAIRVLKDHEHFVRQKDPSIISNSEKMPMQKLDDPEHKRLRDSVSQVFTPRYIQHLRPQIQRITDHLLDKIQNKGYMDLVHDFAYPLSIHGISDILGIAMEDRDQLPPWVEAFTGGVHKIGKEIKLIEEYFSYIDTLIECKRRKPQEDLISRLVQVEEGREALNELELREMVRLLIWAGSESSANFIGIGVLTLLDNPTQMKALKEDLSLIPGAVEELLRFNGPVSLTPPVFAVEDIELGGQHIQKGEAVMVALASANRDEAYFARPDELVLDRNANNHMALGYGIHTCLGASLVRLEADIAFTSLLKRMPHLRLAVSRDALRWRNNFAIRGLTRLPVAF